MELGQNDGMSKTIIDEIVHILSQTTNLCDLKLHFNLNVVSFDIQIQCLIFKKKFCLLEYVKQTMQFN